MLDPKENLDEIKLALKIDTDDDDQEVLRASMAAKTYIKGAIGKDKPSFYEDEEYLDQLNLSMIMLADHYYKARSATMEAGKKLIEYDLGFNSLLLQLKASYRCYEEEAINGY